MWRKNDGGSKSLILNTIMSFNNYHELIWLPLLSFNVSFKDGALCGGVLEACRANFRRCMEMKRRYSTCIVVVLGACMSCRCPTNKECGCNTLYKVFGKQKGNLGHEHTFKMEPRVSR